MFKQRHFLFETDYQRANIEPDKRFQTLPITELNNSQAMQIGQSELDIRLGLYAGAGLLVKAEMLAKGLQTSKLNTPIKSLIGMVAATRVQKSVDLLMQISADKPNLTVDILISLAGMKAQVATAKLEKLFTLKEFKLLFEQYSYSRGTVFEQLSTKALTPFLTAALVSNNLNSDAMRDTLKMLGNLEVKSTIPQLLKLLVADETSSRNEVAKTLEKLQPHLATPKLLTLLSSANDGVRNDAMWALGSIQAKESIPKLITFLSDSNSNMRYVAILGLGQLQAKQATPKIMALLNDSNVREQAVRTLGLLQAKQAIPELIPLLHDTNSNVRSSATLALRQLHATQAIPQLIPLLTDTHSSVNYQTSEALKELQAKEAIPQILALLRTNSDSDVRIQLVDLLGWLQAETAIPNLITLLSDRDDRVREQAALTLGQLKAESAIPQLIALLADKNFEVSYAAAQALGNLQVIEALGKIGNTNTFWLTKFQAEISHEPEHPPLKTDIPKLLAAMDKEGEQSDAAQSLEQLSQQAVIPKWVAWQNQQLEKLKTEFSTTERARKLGFVYQQAAVTQLAALLLETNELTVQTAAESLGKIGAYHPEWLQSQAQLIIKLTSHENINIRIAATTALGNMISFRGNSKAEAFPEFDKTIREHLIKLATDDKQKRLIRITAINALGITERADIAATLFPLLNDNNQKILHFALYRLMGRSEYQPAKETLQNHLALLEQQKQAWRKQRDIDAKKVQIEEFDPTEKIDKSWQYDAQVYQIAYALARIDPQNAGMEMLKHPLYQAREAATRALAEKVNGALLQKLLAYHQNFDWEELPSPRPYATYRAIDKALEQLEYIGTANDLKILQDLRGKMIKPTLSQNPSDKEQQQDAIIQRFDWTIAELEYRLKNTKPSM